MTNKHQGWQPPLSDDARAAVGRCMDIIMEQRNSFLDPAYAGASGMNSLAERFACNCCVQAILEEFGMATPEQEGGL